MRVAAVDGFLLDVPDTPANRAAFGGPVAARGQPSGFPQARVVTLTETGTHSSVDARVGGYCAGEQELAVAMAGSAAGMLVIMDRGFPGVALWKAYTQARAHLLIRARSGPDVHEPGVALLVADPVRDRVLLVLIREVMVPDQDRLAGRAPLAAVLPEVPGQLPSS